MWKIALIIALYWFLIFWWIKFDFEMLIFIIPSLGLYLLTGYLLYKENKI